MIAFRQIGLITLAAVSLTACATRRPELKIPEAPRSLLPLWKLETGDMITTKVYREPDLATQTQVTEAGEAYFPGLGRVKVAGLTVDSLEVDLMGRYNKIIVDPAIDATMTREIVVYGQVRSPGVYGVDPVQTVLGLVAKAGGEIGTGKAPIITLIKGDGRQFKLSREVRLSTLDIVHGDAIYVQDESFFGRNSASLSGLTLVATLVLTVTSLIIIFVR